MNKYRTEEEQLTAIKENRLAIRCIVNPSEKVQLAAVKENGLSIQYINNPSEVVQLEAVKQDGHVIKFIKNPSEEVLKTCLLSNDCDISLLKDEWFDGKSDELRLLYEIRKGI